MRIEVLTLFPEIYDALNVSILGKAIENKLFTVNVTNIRDYSEDKHRHCDDTPFGGGAGMVMTPQPLYSAIQAVDGQHTCLRINLSPRGKVLTAEMAAYLSKQEGILLLNGSYEGIDQRIIDNYIDMELSIGDYVLTSGDFASLVVINCMARFIDGVLGSSESLQEESFTERLLEYPQYTRPQDFMGHTVPEVLLSGNHAEIRKWRRARQLEITALLRPDLLEDTDK